MKLAEFRARDIQQIHAEAASRVGYYQANRLRAFLGRMFNLAIQNDWRSDNPCAGVARYKEAIRETYLSPEQVGRLLEVCDKHIDQNAADAVRLLLFTGARLREVIHAPWSQFDLEQGVWTKPSSHTKTKIRHSVHLPPQVLAMLMRMRGQAVGPYLFPGRDPNSPRVDLKRPWTAITREARIEGAMLHDLRRTFATFMLSTGADAGAVGKVLGHTQASTTARYAQLLKDAQREGASRAVRAMTSPRRVA
jgi:integrase